MEAAELELPPLSIHDRRRAMRSATSVVRGGGAGILLDERHPVDWVGFLAGSAAGAGHGGGEEMGSEDGAVEKSKDFD